MSKNEIKHSILPSIEEHQVRHSHLSRCNFDSIRILDRQASVELTEYTDCRFLILRGDESEDLIRNGLKGGDSLKSGLRALLNIDLPVIPMTSVQSGCSNVWWIGPSEWILIGPTSQFKDIEENLRRQLKEEFAVVDVSGGFVLLGLEGIEAEAVIRKSSPYNVNAENFPIGKVVGTRFGKTQVTLRRFKDGFQILCRSSFSDYLWAWLRDASREFGLEIRKKNI